MAKDKNKVAPADGALVKQGSAKRRNRKAWPGDEAAEDKSPKSGKRRGASWDEVLESCWNEGGSGCPLRASIRTAPVNKWRRRLRKASLAKEETKGDRAPEQHSRTARRLKGAERKRAGGRRFVGQVRCRPGLPTADVEGGRT